MKDQVTTTVPYKQCQLHVLVGLFLMKNNLRFGKFRFNDFLFLLLKYYFEFMFNKRGRYNVLNIVLSHSFLLIKHDMVCKVEKILKGSLDSFSSPLPSVKIQII